MVLYIDKKTGVSWHEPPYTKEEQWEMWNRWGDGPSAFTRPGPRPDAAPVKATEAAPVTPSEPQLPLEPRADAPRQEPAGAQRSDLMPYSHAVGAVVAYAKPGA
jgi:hypothetical protein